jgi:hypothetical protein
MKQPDLTKKKSWKPEVRVAGEGTTWHGNALRFATKEEAEANARNLYNRWTLTTDWRASESDDEPNYRWIEGKLYAIEEQLPKREAE